MSSFRGASANASTRLPAWPHCQPHRFRAHQPRRGQRPRHRCGGRNRFLLHSDPDEVRGADVAFISRARYEAARFSQDKHFRGAPDLVVEVVSPSDSYSEVEEKVLMWRACARMVIVADPKKQIFFAHRPGASPETLTSSNALAGDPVVPGWVFKVGDAFPA